LAGDFLLAGAFLLRAEPECDFITSRKVDFSPLVNLTLRPVGLRPRAARITEETLRLFAGVIFLRAGIINILSVNYHAVVDILP
jgi:hypothetical protein